MTPYFTRLGLTSLINSLIWLIPYCILWVTRRFFKKFAYSKHIHIFLSMTTGISIAGCLLFIFAGSICEWYMKTNINNNKSARFYALNLGIFGFVILQCSLITCSDTITNVLVQSNKFEGFAELWVFRWKTIGRVAGYVLASLDIFETYTLRVYYVNCI